ncbi:MAG: cysteine-rich repeat protein, partial [Flavobacteriales bacterium]
MNWQRLLSLGALSTAWCACAPLDDPAPVSDDIFTLTEDVVEARETEQSSLTNQVTLAEFEGTVLEDGSLQIEMLDISDWDTPIEFDADLDLRSVEQALWCPIRASNGARGTVVLTTDAGSIGNTSGACGLPAGFPYTVLGVFCANVTAASASDARFGNVQAEITSVIPSVGYNGYTFATTGGVVGTDPGSLAGVGAPVGTLGLFGFGTLNDGDAIATQWAFENAGGAFMFSGRVVAELEEICGDAFDNDCDGELNEVCAPFGDPCIDNVDCLSGNCEVGVCAASTCENTFFDAATETDVDCGASCDGCATGLSCVQDSDCFTEICLDGLCADAECGDAIVGPGEACDDGNGVDTDGCTNACTAAVYDNL